MFGALGVWSTYDHFVELICPECKAYREERTLDGYEECTPCNSLCRFWSEFEELEKLCRKVDALAGSIKEDTERYNPYDDELAAENI